MAKTPGSIWVDGAQLHFVDKNGAQWYFTGTDTGASVGSAVQGSFWVSGDFLYYISGAPATCRRLPATVVAYRAGATAGSPWVDTGASAISSLHYIDASGYEQSAYNLTTTPGSSATSAYMYWRHRLSGNGGIDGVTPMSLTIITTGIAVLSVIKPIPFAQH